MKSSVLIFCFLIAACSAYSQRESVGIGAGVPYYSPTTAQEAKMEWEKRIQAIPPDHNVFRAVNGQTYNILYAQTWKVISGKIDSEENGILILRFQVWTTAWMGNTGYRTTKDAYLAIKNYPGNPTAETDISVLALRIGNYDWNGTPLEFYDCGLPSSPPPPTPQEIDNAKNQAALNQRRMREGQTNAVHWLLLRCTNGAASDQYDLAVHYLNGQGCETNKQQAIFWLQKASAQGSLEASNKLFSLTRH